MFLKYLNHGWDIGLCFISSPWDPSSVSDHLPCSTLVKTEWGVSLMQGIFDCVSRAEHGIHQLFHKLTINPSSILVRRACFKLVRNGCTMFQ
jgi:hypothetical protein